MSNPGGPDQPQDGTPPHDQQPWQQPAPQEPWQRQPPQPWDQQQQPWDQQQQPWDQQQQPWDQQPPQQQPWDQQPPYGPQYGGPQYSGQQYGAPQYGGQQYGAPQYGGQQYGAPQYGAPQYGFQQAPPQRSSSRAALIVLTVAVLVVAAAVVGIVLLTTGDDDKKNDAQTPPPTAVRSAQPSLTTLTPSSATSSTSAPAASASPTGGSSPTSVEQISIPAVTPGWKGVWSYKDGAAYDVPPSAWTIESPGVLVGFEDNKGKPIAIMHGVSTYKDEACPSVSGSYRAHTGFQTAGNLSVSTAARGGLKLFADGIALRDNGTSAPITGTTVQNIRVNRGRTPAVFARATVQTKTRADCGSPSVLVVAVAFRVGPNATALFIGYADQGVSDALSPATFSTMFKSLRPYRR